MPSKAKVKLQVRTARNADRLLSFGLPGGRLTLKVGFLGNGTADRGEDGITNPELAAVQEYGYPEGNIPARPFVGPSWEQHRAEYQEQVRVLAQRASSSGASLERGLGLLGEKMVTDMRNYVVAGASIAPENAPSVKRRKERTSSRTPWGVRTLVDTGALMRSISWAVVRE